MDRAESGIVELACNACLHRHKSGAADDGGGVAGELVLVEDVTDFHINELEELLVIDLVALVEEDDDVGHADLTSEKNVLAGLGHGTVGSSHDEDSAVHLRRTGDHVLNIVRVSGAVNVRIVSLVGLILNVRGVDCDTTCLLFGSLVDLVILHRRRFTLVSTVHRDSCCQGRLAVVNVTNGTDVNVHFAFVKFFLCHC